MPGTTEPPFNPDAASPVPEAGLAAAFRRYTANLLAAAPNGPAKVYVALLDEAAENKPGRSTWAWARLLAAWPDWRPHRVERRLTLPPREKLAELAACCHVAAGPNEAGSRWWNKIGLGSTPTARAVDPKELLGECATLLEALATPPSPAIRAAMDRAVELGREVDSLLVELPPQWLPGRLARAAAGVDLWPPPPDPAVEAGGFLPCLRHLIRAVLARDHCPAIELFPAMLREPLDDLLSGGHLGTDPETRDTLTAFAALDQPAPAAEWLRVFGTLFRLANTDGIASEWPRTLARLACHAIHGLVPEFEPPVDPKSLTVAKGFKPDRAVARYEVNSAVARTVCRVDRFVVPPDRAQVTISLGPRPAASQLWLTVADPAELPTLPDGAWKGMFARSRKRAEAQFWGRPTDESTGDDGWAAWLGTEPGRAWFHEIAFLATSPEPAAATAARGWLATLTGAARVQCFPPIEPVSGRPRWSEGVSFAQPGVTFAADTELAGTVIGVQQSGISPQTCRVTISLGPDPGTRAMLAAVWEATTRGGPDLQGVRGKLVPLIDATVRAEQAPSPEDLVHMLDAIGELEPTEDAALRTARDEVLTRLREWATAEGLTVLPEGWTFTTGGPGPLAPPDGLMVKTVFRVGVPAGQIARVRAFGLVGPDGVVRAGDVLLSGGPPPHGLTGMENAAEAAPGDAGQELRDVFKSLRQAGAGGYLDMAALDLYTLFWDRVYPEWAAHDPDAADTFADQLRAMMDETFGLEMFSPESFHDYPGGWVSVPPGTRMNTGRVVRVLRPGLATGSTLHVPARVEVE